GETEKFNDNIRAIETLKQIERDGRRATPEEQKVLARYVGWGGLANAFANPTTGEVKKGWEDRAAKLSGMLDDKELAAARNSTQNAHYTSPTVVSAVWDAVRHLGYRTGIALEPSVGKGLAPEDMRSTKFVGVEYDSLTARIAGALYPQASIIHSGLEKVPVPEGSFDLVIGNPPFGKTSLSFSYSPEISRYSIHNQFFLAGVKALKPGGIQAMVVSRYLLDAVDSTSRTAIAKHARLLGAIRLPDSAFKENARTEVVTDIIFLQRLTPEEETAQEELAITPSWIETTKVPDPLGGDPINVNSYFAENKKAIIGTLERSGSMQHGADVTVRLDKSEDFAKLLSQSIKDVLPKSVAHNRYAGDGIDQRFESMRTGLEIAMAGHEPGSVSINKDGKLEHIFEREQENGQWAMTRRILSADSPWSQQLSMDKDGNWFREVPKLDKDGNKAKDGKRNVYVREVFTKESDIPASLRMGQLSFDKLKYLSTIRDFLMKQINLEMNDEPDAVIESNRTELKKKYDEFVGKYGLISDSKNAKVVSEMPDEGRIMSLEHSFKKGISKLVAEKTRVKPREATAKQAAILSERVAFKPKLIETADSPGDAVLISLAESGSIDMDRISELLGVSKDEAIDKLHDSLDVPLVFKNPESGSWEHADEYLSGQVVRKLEAAKQAGISKNVRSLEKVVPEQWGPENITAVIGSTWVSPSDYEEFLKHLTGEKAKVSYSKISNSYSIEGSLNSVAGAAWRTEDASTAFLVDALLNSGSVNIYWKDEDGKRHLNQEASELAAMKAQEIESEFSDWAFSDSDRRNRLVKRFNDRYNTRVPRQRDGSHMTLPGKVPDVIIKLRRHQMNAVWRGVMDRFTLYDHAVGAGKSFTAIARAMERKRMGISRKPMIVVPNHLVEQFAADVYRLYPGANVLSAGNKDFAKKNRRRLFAKIATGNWDIVVVPHSSFKAIGISGEAEQRFLDQDLAKAMEAVNEAEEQAMEDGEDQGFRKPHTVKMAEAMVTTITGKIDKLKSKTRDGLLSFEQLGIDDLTVDEAHEFKNLWYSSRQSVRGMNPKLGSEKAFDLYNKIRVMRESPTGSVTFMTGTPISNSAVEMYGMMRYLAADELQELGLDHFDAWRAQYTSVSSKFEPTESGNSLKEVKRLGRDWVNMRSLMDFYYSFTDCVTNEDIKKWYKEDNNGEDFPIPKVKGGGRQAFVVPPTPAQQLELAEVIQGFKDLPAEKNPKVRNGNRLRLMDRARKISLDARAVNPHNPSKEEGGKLEKISDETYKIYQEWNKDLGTQLIFLDRSIPRSSGDAKELKAYDDLIARMDAAGNDEDLARSLEESLEKYNPQEMEEMRNAQAGGWNAYQQLKDNLIAKGVPEKEIRFIQDASTELQKKELFEMVNSGEVRILIGSTPKMGAGTNVQERLVDIHHGDVTWKPSDIEQREGRIIRQGNKLLEKYGEKFEVIIQAYVTESTIDSKLWDLNATKLKMINGIRHYNGEFTMEFEDEDSVGMAEIAAIASGNPLQLERVKLAAEIDRLDRAGKAHQRQIYAAQGNLENAKRIAETYPDRVKEGEERNKTISDALAEKEKNIAERSIVINGKTYTMSSKWDAWTLLEVLKEEGNGHGKKKDTFIVGIDGKAYSSFTKASEVLESRFGDTVEFLATMGGTAYIARVDLARAIAKASNEKTKSMKDGDEAVIGMYQSDGAEITLEANAYFVNETIGLAISLSATSRINGKLVGHEVRDIGLPGNATAVNTKPLVGTIDKVTSDSRDDYDIDKEHLENAIKGIPEYEKLAKRTFPKAEELETKRTRLQEVIRELAAAESTSGVVDQVDAVQLITQLEGRPLRSEGKAVSTGNTIESVISELRDFIGAGYANLVRRGKLEIVRTEAGLPENVRKNGEPLYSKDGTIAGAYYKGVTYLVADSIRKGDVKNIFVHEALHANFREDKRFMSQKAKILADFSALTSQEAVDARAKVPKDTPAELVDEEGLAYMVQANPKHSLVRRIIAAVKAALFRLGIPVGKLNEADLVALFTQGAKSWSKQGGTVKESLTTGDYATAFAKQYGISVAESQKQYADAVKQYGADAWKKAKAAGKTKLDERQFYQVRTPAFKEWFGDWENNFKGDIARSATSDPRTDSKSSLEEIGYGQLYAIDRDTDEPVIFYHGSNASIDTFRSKNESDGIYFSTDEDYARGYGDVKADVYGGTSTMHQTFLRMLNPLEIDGENEAEWEKYTQRGFDAKVLMEKGYDGVVMKYSDGEIEAMAFSPNQIKSATENTGQFSAANDDIRYSRKAQEEDEPSFAAPVESKKDTILYNAQNKFIDLFRIQDAIIKAGGTITEETDVRLAEELFHKRAETRTKDFLMDEVRPLMDELGKIDKDETRFESFLHARHAEEANEHLRLRNPNAEELDE
ncbi:MAG: hypothetical protein JZU65_17720, partial [Chlorobium sp.]|nr:hypothetical protein [Chlorobium sp.]